MNEDPPTSQSDPAHVASMQCIHYTSRCARVIADEQPRTFHPWEGDVFEDGRGLCDDKKTSLDDRRIEIDDERTGRGVEYQFRSLMVWCDPITFVSIESVVFELPRQSGFLIRGRFGLIGCPVCSKAWPALAELS